MRICGRNTMTLPTPEIAPFSRKLCNSPAGNVLCTSCPSAPKAADNSSIKGCAQANTAWNITNKMSARIASPATGCSICAALPSNTVRSRVTRFT